MNERIVDACTLINLYGSRRQLDILSVIGGMSLTSQVRRESLGLRAEDPERPGELLHEQIDLSEAIDQSLLRVCELTEAEFARMIQFARELDDGEASSLAVAQARQWKLATDDKKSRRIAQENGVAVVSSSELVYRWAQETETDGAELRTALQAIRRYARFSPPTSDPLFDWWEQHLDA